MCVNVQVHVCKNAGIYICTCILGTDTNTKSYYNIVHIHYVYIHV